MKTAAEILREYGLPQPPAGKDRYFTTCPKCSATRSKAKLKCLGISIKPGGVQFGCNHCDFKGGAYYNGKDNNPIIATYDYTDESGRVLFRKVRAAPKKFWQERPDGHSGWAKGIKNIRRVLYKLPELKEAIATERAVLIVEGEKDVDRLRQLGVPATCNPEGASEPGKKLKWRADYTESLRGANIVLIPDNDEPGWKHVQNVGAALAGIAARTRVLALPNLPPKGDVSDWLDAGGTREQFDALVEQAPDWKPPSADKASSETNADEKAKAKAREDELLAALAMAKGLDYVRQRKTVADELEVTAKAIDDEVRARREDAQTAPLYGHWIVEPWPEPVDGDSLLRDIIKRIKRHVIISDDNALTIALWIMMSWVHDGVATHSPILNINSAEPESGKSTTMGLVAFLMPKCIASVEASEAAIYRAIKRWQPSFCFDEFDSILADDDKAALRSVINSGHTRGQGVLRCIGDDKTPELFPTFAPKAIGMVGRKLPPATLSRCIFVELRRRKRDEPVEEFKSVDDSGLTDLRRRLRRWAIDNDDTLRDAKPALPDELYNRRADNWKLQLLIADLAGLDWGDKARAAALKIEGKTDNRTLSVRLLADTKVLFDADPLAHCMHSATIVADLVADPEKAWAECPNARGTSTKPLTQNRLAELVGIYGITSQTVAPPGQKTAKGYYRRQFEEAWSIYLP